MRHKTFIYRSMMCVCMPVQNKNECKYPGVLLYCTLVHLRAFGPCWSYAGATVGFMLSYIYRLVHVGLLLAQKLGVWVSIEVSLQFWGHVGAMLGLLGPCWGYVRPVRNKLLGVYEVILVQVGLLLVQIGAPWSFHLRASRSPQYLPAPRC